MTRVNQPRSHSQPEDKAEPAALNKDVNMHKATGGNTPHWGQEEVDPQDLEKLPNPQIQARCSKWSPPGQPIWRTWCCWCRGNQRQCATPQLLCCSDIAQWVLVSGHFTLYHRSLHAPQDWDHQWWQCVWPQPTFRWPARKATAMRSLAGIVPSGTLKTLRSPFWTSSSILRHSAAQTEYHVHTWLGKICAFLCQCTSEHVSDKSPWPLIITQCPSSQWTNNRLIMGGQLQTTQGTYRPSFPQICSRLGMCYATTAETCINKCSKTQDFCAAFRKLQTMFLGPGFTQQWAVQLKEE